MLNIIIVQIIIVLINAYIATTEKKTRIYIVTFLFNLANLIMYYINDDSATAILYVIITTRSFIYIFKDRFKTIVIPMLMILIQLLIGFKNIENLWQLIPIITPCLVCYYMWFCRTTQQLRIWNAVCNGFWGIYNLKTGLYIVMVNRFITVAVNVVSYLKNRKQPVSI